MCINCKLSSLNFGTLTKLISPVTITGKTRTNSAIYIIINLYDEENV